MGDRPDQRPLSVAERLLLLHADLMGVVAVPLNADVALASLLDRGLVDVQPWGGGHALVFLTDAGHDVALILRRKRRPRP